MTTYRNLLLNQASAEIDSLVANPPPAGTDLHKVYKLLTAGPSSTEPDYVIGWLDQILFNKGNPVFTNLDQQGAQILAAIGAPTSFTGTDPLKGVIPVRLAEALYAETGLAQIDPGAVEEIQAALSQAMIDLPPLASAPSVVIAWVNQSVVAKDPPVLNTLGQTQALGDEKRTIVATGGTGTEVETMSAEAKSATK
jgi:hypothetical protein